LQKRKEGGKIHGQKSLMRSEEERNLPRKKHKTSFKPIISATKGQGCPAKKQKNSSKENAHRKGGGTSKVEREYLAGVGKQTKGGKAPLGGRSARKKFLFSRREKGV